MNCFNHDDVPAVGMCKSCGKGICRECLKEIPDGLACKGTCVDRSVMINRIIDNNQRMVSAANSQIKNGGWLTVAIGVFICAMGILLSYGESFFPFGLISGVIGLTFLGFGIRFLLKRSAYPSVDD